MRAARFSWLFFTLFALAAPTARGQCIPQYPENVCPCGNGTCDAGEDRMSCPQDCPVGCNNDSVCEEEYGEDAQSCPFDCDEVTCEPSCVGQCGPTPICNQGVIDCPCVTCGDERCDPGEDCPEDCGSSCVSVMPLFSASANAAQVGQSITFTADPSRALFEPVPQWDMGNGVHLTGSQISYAYPGAGTFPVILTASETACERTVDSDPVFVTISDQPISCDLEGIPPSAQRCCGDGTCQGGETPDDCSSDCPAWCGDQHCSVTQGEDLASCPTDCCPSGTVCAAGCAPIPTFTISNTQPARFEAVTFAANASQVEGSFVNWDFGDGHHCEGCPLTTTHRYELQGSYPVRLTVTENVCGSTKVSVPWTITVGPTAPEPWAQVVESGLPVCVRPNEVRPASIRVRNIGGTTWSPANHDGLWMVEPPISETLFTPTSLPVAQAVPPGGEYVFNFNFGTASAPEGDYTVVYRMGNSSPVVYGDPASHRVTVASTCALPPVAPPTGDYTCHATLRHPSGGGVPGIAVELASYAIQGEQEVKVASKWGETRPDGGVELPLNRDPLRPATRVTCRFDVERPHVPVIDGSPEETKVDPVEVAVPTQLNLDRLVKSTFRRTISVRGEKEGTAVARLYQSGPYDKPVVIPKPFDPGELTAERLTSARLEERFGPFLKAANAKGYDVWLTNTNTGQNIHEQAAEFAQIIDAAASILGPDGRVIVAGYSLGGVTARLATARYQADPTWRKALGLRNELPVSLIAFGDAPLRGAHISYDLQRALWEDVGHGAEWKTNLNSCAAQQLLRSSYPTRDQNFGAFWEAGSPVGFLGRGVYCDEQDIFGICRCDPGPAVFSLNGDGWAHGIPMVAFSDGHDGPQACYGGDDDIARDKNVCQDLNILVGGGAFPQFPFFPQVGDKMFRVKVPFLGSDLWVDAYSEDIAPGSRLGSIRGLEKGFLGIAGGIELQVFSPTFIPFDSALPPGAPFEATWHATHNGIHGVGNGDNIVDLLEAMDAVTGTGAASSVTGTSAVSVRPESATGGAPLELTFPSPDRLPQVPIELVITSDGPEPPSSYVHGVPARYYTLSADFSGAVAPTWREPVQVCVDYSGTAFMDAARLGLFHQETVGWVDVTSDVDLEAQRICGNATALATFALLEPTNRSPIVHAGRDLVIEATSPEGAEVVVVPQGTHDPDEEPVTYEWRDAGGEVLAEGATISRVFPLGAHELTLTVRDSRGGEASDALTVTVTEAPPTFISEYATGNWRGCSGEGGWTCVAGGAAGCSRPGTQTRTVTPAAWTADSALAVTEPPSIQACTETTIGYVSAYDAGAWGGCSGTDAWNCTSASGTGCSRPGTQARSVTATTWTAESSQAQPAPTTTQACIQTAPGYVASYSVGNWSTCSSTCGSGNQTRSVTPSGYTASAPGVAAPDSVQGCSGESCTCDDMGWYGADDRSQCDSDCGQACTKKQWCGSNECEPWPHYCWKC